MGQLQIFLSWDRQTCIFEGIGQPIVTFPAEINSIHSYTASRTTSTNPWGSKWLYAHSSKFQHCPSSRSELNVQRHGMIRTILKHFGKRSRADGFENYLFCLQRAISSYCLLLLGTKCPPPHPYLSQQWVPKSMTSPGNTGLDFCPFRTRLIRPAITELTGLPIDISFVVTWADAFKSVVALENLHWWRLVNRAESLCPARMENLANVWLLVRLNAHDSFKTRARLSSHSGSASQWSK